MKTSTQTNTNPYILEPIQRLTRDIRSAAAQLGDEEARFLVDAYYMMQDDRKRSRAQEMTLDKANEPNLVISWLATQSETLENQIKSALDVYTQSHKMGSWMRCAPTGTMIRTSSRTSTNIENLETGHSVISFNRHKSTLTKPKPIQVASRVYNGDLIRLTCAATSTRTTPEHKWVAKFDKSKDPGIAVYLMRSGDRFRIGRCAFYYRQQYSHGLFWNVHVRTRARQEQASVWILRTFSTVYEANIYEEFVATHYGLTEWTFKANSGTLVDQTATEKLFSMFNATVQYERAKRCLSDHGKNIDFPFWGWTGSTKDQSPTEGLETAAYNLMAEVMLVPVPTNVYHKIDWVPITNLVQEYYNGNVYSLDVETHHKYIQDDIITCNSIYGIGPVISAGLLAHIDIEKAPTVGHIWQYAGIAGSGQKPWEKGKPRPYNAKLKTLTWKAGQSFMKFSNHLECVYGHHYKEQKDVYVAKNESNGFAERAAVLVTKVKSTTDAYKFYSVGKLPPAHIDAMARRWAVKLFLAHLHGEWYLRHFDKPAPLPYPIAILGHTHMI